MREFAFRLPRASEWRLFAIINGERGYSKNACSRSAAAMPAGERLLLFPDGNHILFCPDKQRAVYDRRGGLNQHIA